MIWLWWIYSSVLALFALRNVLQVRSGLPTIEVLTRPEWDAASAESHPRLSVIVPACNEEEGIRACLESLAAQDYNNLEIIAVNDRSTDRTGEIMSQVAAAEGGRIRVVHIQQLPAGWLGKTHALWTGVAESTGDWLLFTDGDVFFRPDALRRCLAYAERERTDHLVLFVTMIAKSVGERMMVAIGAIALSWLRPWKVADPKSSAFMGWGAFNMVRRSAYDGIGTMRALRLAVIEDMGLGKRIKRMGFKSRVALGPGLVRCYWGKGAFGMVRNLTKNSYAMVRFQWWRALAIILLLLAFHVGPFVFVWLAPGFTKIGFAIVLAGIFYLYACFCGPVFAVPPIYFFLHPAAGLLIVYAVVRSVVVTIRNGGVEWRGTLYSIEELRRASLEDSIKGEIGGQTPNS